MTWEKLASTDGLSCVQCGSPAVRREGRKTYCARHYRFQQMRNTARQDGKIVPSLDELECLADMGMTCPNCRCDMHWLASDGPDVTQLTLQHDRGGAVLFLCQRCNSRHTGFPGDEFYGTTADHKYCPRCRRILALDEFGINVAEPRGRQSYCVNCKNQIQREWVNNNREHSRAYKREWRAAQTTKSQTKESR